MNDRPDAVAIARRFLDAMEERDLDAAQSLLSPDFAAVYPGDRRFRRLEDIVASGSGRYRDVRKTYLRTYFIPSGPGGVEVVVFSGTLSGAWADGEAFEGIRFTDQFRLADGLILEQHVWNDIGEALLRRLGGAPR